MDFEYGKTPDYFAVLGVAKDADDNEIEKAYRKLALLHHPDRKGGDIVKFQEINIAHDVLTDPVKRRHYELSQPDTDGYFERAQRGGEFEERYPASGRYIVTQAGVLIRVDPTPSADIHPKEYLVYGDVFEIKASMQKGAQVYFELSDGGWIFARNGHTVMVEETGDVIPESETPQQKEENSFWYQACNFISVNLLTTFSSYLIAQDAANGTPKKPRNISKLREKARSLVNNEKQRLLRLKQFRENSPQKE